MYTIVQFTHPGGEHEPDKKNGDYKSWNDGTHKRKFMLCDGSYVDTQGEIHEGKLTLWGEWEPPSKVDVLANQPNKQFPRWLHRPYLPGELPKSGGYQKSFQNTDPFIFEDGFRYFVCKQFQPKRRSITHLARLEKGSVILFGSTHGQKKETAFFQLDTIFVVSDFIEYDPSDPYALNLESLGNYRDIVFKMAFPNPLNYSLKLRLYFGATYKNPVDGMYSFVPSKIFKDNNQGFPRVRLQDINYLTNNLNAAPRFTSFSSIEEVKNFWEKIRNISREQGCVEGVVFKYEKE